MAPPFPLIAIPSSPTLTLYNTQYIILPFVIEPDHFSKVHQQLKYHILYNDNYLIILRDYLIFTLLIESLVIWCYMQVGNEF